MSEKGDDNYIGGFHYASLNCMGCKKPLKLSNAWMSDGCPCNSTKGINSTNEVRWRLLMELHQRQQEEYLHHIENIQLMIKRICDDVMHGNGELRDVRIDDEVRMSIVTLVERNYHHFYGG